MKQPISIFVQEEKNTDLLGHSLAFSLYKTPLTIFLLGEVGAGKTTLLRGLAKGLGVEADIVSPTYALIQQYATGKGAPFLHADLYRLNEAQAAEVLTHVDDHQGILCIEWADRLPSPLYHKGDRIVIRLSEEKGGRRVTIDFLDMPLPTSAQIEQWRKDVLLPDHIVAHCDAVADLSERFAEYLLSQHRIIRPEAVRRAGETHDLLRFIDFHNGTKHFFRENSEEEKAHWQRWANRYPGLNHEAACASFLREQGYAELAEIVAVHGLHPSPPPDRPTIEQKLLFYADKRVLMDKVVSLEERFADFRVRYGNGRDSAQSRQWHDEATHVEKELFPNGVPF